MKILDYNEYRSWMVDEKSCPPSTQGMRFASSACASIIAIMVAVEISSAQEVTPASSVYVGYVVRLNGGPAWLHHRSTSEMIHLSSTNARGHLIFSTTEVRCEPLSRLDVQLGWGTGITNLTSTNWTRLTAPIFPASQKLDDLAPAGGIAHGSPQNTAPSQVQDSAPSTVGGVDTGSSFRTFRQRTMILDSLLGAKSKIININAYNSILLSTGAAAGYFSPPKDSGIIGAFIGPREALGLNPIWRQEVIQLLQKDIPDYQRAALILHGWLENWRELAPSLPTSVRDSCVPLVEMVELSHTYTRMMRRQAALNILQDLEMLTESIRRGLP